MNRRIVTIVSFRVGCVLNTAVAFAVLTRPVDARLAAFGLAAGNAALSASIWFGAGRPLGILWIHHKWITTAMVLIAALAGYCLGMAIAQS